MPAFHLLLQVTVTEKHKENLGSEICVWEAENLTFIFIYMRGGVHEHVCVHVYVQVCVEAKG